jgi:acyl-CoA reductase-like NAD-dependent aldehyde dehydrogenase
VETFRVLVGGHRVEAAGGGWIESHNPFTGKTWSKLRRGGPQDVENTIAAAKVAFRSNEWRDSSLRRAACCSIANGTLCGLAAGVWTRSNRRALLMSERLEAGTIWVNTYQAVSYLSPVGGYRHSGIGGLAQAANTCRPRACGSTPASSKPAKVGPTRCV